MSGAITRLRISSQMPRKAAIPTVIPMTASVRLLASCRVGHVTLRSSALDSWKKAKRLGGLRRAGTLACGRLPSRAGPRDPSNDRPAALSCGVDAVDLATVHLDGSGCGRSGFAPPGTTDPQDGRRKVLWQARHDSNVQPLVLETSALPIELRAFVPELLSSVSGP